MSKTGSLKKSNNKSLKQTKLKRKKDELINELTKRTKQIKLNDGKEVTKGLMKFIFTFHKEYEIDKILDVKVGEKNEILYKVL